MVRNVKFPVPLMKIAIRLPMLALLLPLHAAAGDYSALLSKAPGALDNDYASDWAFTETSVDSEITTVARFDPSGPDGERWHLLTVNGRNPTATEVADFREERTEDFPEDSDDDDPGNDVEEMVQPGSLSLIEETDSYWLFNFLPAEDGDDEGILEHLEATLKIVKGGPYIEFISLQSNKLFRPKFGVKISNLTTRLVFGPAAMNGPIVPVSVDIGIKARAFLAISVDETVSISF